MLAVLEVFVFVGVIFMYMNDGCWWCEKGDEAPFGERWYR